MLSFWRACLAICIIYVYNGDVKIKWDPGKAAANFKKHGIRFSDAEFVLFDPNARTKEDEDAYGERRFVTMGFDAVGRILVVVYN